MDSVIEDLMLKLVVFLGVDEADEEVLSTLPDL